MQPDKFYYDNKIVRDFAIATMVWGIIGMLVGLLVASQLVSPAANLGSQYTTFGRIRPLHTNAVIFLSKQGLSARRPCAKIWIIAGSSSRYPARTEIYYVNG